jgi:glycosyltransferase involved in cell wall biosynthesis
MEDFLAWTKQFNNIVYDRLARNSGPGFARNRGIELSAGKWIFFLDSDDIIYPEKLPELICFLETENADVTFLSSKNIKAQNGQCHTLKFLKQTSNKFDDVISCFPYCGAAYSFVYSKEFLVKKQINFNHLQFSEDFCFTLKAVCLAKTISICDILFYQYNDMSKGSITINKFNDKNYYAKKTCIKNSVFNAFKQIYGSCLSEKKACMSRFLKSFIFYAKIKDINDKNLHSIEADALSDFQNSLKPYIQKNIYISPVCDAYSLVLNLLKSVHANFAGFLDNNTTSVSALAVKNAGINVDKLSDFQKNDNTFIFVMGWSRKEIAAQLENSGFVCGKDFAVLDYF